MGTYPSFVNLYMDKDSVYIPRIRGYCLPCLRLARCRALSCQRAPGHPLQYPLSCKGPTNAQEGCILSSVGTSTVWISTFSVATQTMSVVKVACDVSIPSPFPLQTFSLPRPLRRGQLVAHGQLGKTRRGSCRRQRIKSSAKSLSETQWDKCQGLQEDAIG